VFLGRLDKIAFGLMRGSTRQQVCDRGHARLPSIDAILSGYFCGEGSENGPLGEGPSDRRSQEVCQMPKINIDGGPHGTITLSAGTADEMRFWTYAKKSSQLRQLERAVWIVQHNIYKKKNSCNKYFKTLKADGTSRSFDEVWEDPDIWINYEPRISLGWDGATNSVGGKEITIGEEAYRKGNVWYVTGVLVHELAHTNGAGVAPSKAASTALKFCGLAALYDGAVGVAPRAEKGTDERVV
jgi:hypothetical protein